jgi:hypothetical protein
MWSADRLGRGARVGEHPAADAHALIARVDVDGLGLKPYSLEALALGGVELQVAGRNIPKAGDEVARPGRLDLARIVSRR